MATLTGKSAEKFLGSNPTVLGNEASLISKVPKVEIPKEKGYFERVSDSIKEDANKRIDKTTEILKRPDTGLVERETQVLGQGAGLVGHAMESAVGEIPGVKQALEGFGKGVGWLSEQPIIKKTGEAIGNNKLLQEAIQLYDNDANFKDTLDGVVNQFRLAGDVDAGLGVGTKAVNLAKNTSLKAGETVLNVAKGTGEKISNTLTKGKELVTPTKTVDEALGQIGQGKTESIRPLQSTLESIDTTGAATFKDLQTKIKESIPEYARKVDEELSKDTGVYKLKDLEIKNTTKGGKTVATDYVSKALSDLKELYKNTGDKVSETNIGELLNKAETNGLTRKEVNDISRTYGSEFGEKAFNKMGDPITSVNAQAFENTRTGLKDVARQGLGGEEAKALDSKLSDMYDSQKLIDKNVEAVNKLQQKIQERGLVEKAGYLLAKYGDIVTGGSIRGFVGGILPRGAGYKVMNALDVEAALRKNLDIVEKALKQKTDAGMIKVLQSSDSASSNLANSSLNKKVASTNKSSNNIISTTVPQKKGIIQTAIDNLKTPKGRQGGFVKNIFEDKVANNIGTLTDIADKNINMLDEAGYLHEMTDKVAKGGKLSDAEKRLYNITAKGLGRPDLVIDIKAKKAAKQKK